MKMKKLFKVFSIGCALALLITATPVYAKEGAQPSKEDVIEEFNKLQSEIDNVLKIKDNEYVFNKEDVIKVIDESTFDFNSYNQYFHTNFTKDSFATTVIGMIETTDLEYQSNGDNTCSVYGTYCGKNGTSSGWNYNRAYNDKRNSERAASGLDQLSRNWSLIGSGAGIAALIPGIGPYIAAGIGAGAGWSSWYTSTLAAAVRSNNSDGNCGTVTDINKFTTAFSVWSQREFYE